MEKEFERGVREAGEEDRRDEVERKGKEVERFERTMQGLDGAGTNAGGRRGVKRKAQMTDEGEGGKDAEKSLPSFWIPSLTPEAKKARLGAMPKLQPLCPASSPDTKHGISLKSLVAVKFKYSEESKGKENTEERDAAPICPACVKGLSNTNKAVLAMPCGHVLCKPCARKLMKADTEPDPHNPSSVGGGKVRCFVCEEDVTPEEMSRKTEQEVNSNDDEDRGGDARRDKKKRKKGEDVGGVRRGMVELKCEGTGFAGGGDNMVKKGGTAFQC